MRRANKVRKSYRTLKQNIMELKPTNEILPDDNDENTVIAESSNLVEVDKDQLKALVEQNQTMKTEIGQMVGLFQVFAPLLSGKGVIGLMGAIPKLINDPNIAAKVSELMPIIDKYTVNPGHE